MTGVGTSLRVIVLFGALSGCAAAIPASPGPLSPPEASIASQPTPTSLLQPLPSNACGGFHLTIHNQTTQDVAVTVNQGSALTIDPDETVTLVEWLPGPVDLPLMPWTVTLAGASDGEVIGTEEFNAGEADTSLSVTENGVGSASGSLCRS